MRTTITLDDDLFEALRDLAHDKRQPFKRVLNDALREGLQFDRPQPRRFVQRTSHMGAPTVNLTRALQIAGELEDEEITRRMRKR